MPSSGAVIVIFRRGGADGLTLVPPIGDDDYRRARRGLAIAQGDARRLDDLFSLHPRLAPLEPFYREGHLAVVPAVGCASDTRSHFEAQDIVESGGEGKGGGWGRRWGWRPPPRGSGIFGIAPGAPEPPPRPPPRPGGGAGGMLGLRDACGP